MKSATRGLAVPKLTDLDIGKCLLYTTDDHEIVLNRDHDPEELRNISMSITEKHLSLQRLITKIKQIRLK